SRAGCRAEGLHGAALRRGGYAGALDLFLRLVAAPESGASERSDGTAVGLSAPRRARSARRPPNFLTTRDPILESSALMKRLGVLLWCAALVLFAAPLLNAADAPPPTGSAVESATEIEAKKTAVVAAVAAAEAAK